MREMATAGTPIRVPVAVACRVLGLSKAGLLPVVQGPGVAAGLRRAHLINAALAGHAAALRVAAIILVMRTRPAGSGRFTRPQNAWALVAVVAPKFGEWAGYFAATEGKRDAVRAGAGSIVTVRESDDLLRDVRTFLALVEQTVRRRAGTGRSRLDAG